MLALNFPQKQQKVDKNKKLICDEKNLPHLEF